MNPPYTVRVDSRFGAPHGRYSDLEPSTGDVLYLHPVPMVDGDYDAGGAYWGGGGEPLWCAWSNDGKRMFLRAPNRERARQQFPNASFHEDEASAHGFTLCSCPDCRELVLNDGDHGLCSACEAAGCEEYGDACLRDDHQA